MDAFLTISKKDFSKPTELFVLEEMIVRLGSKAMPVLKELVEGTLEGDFTKATNASVWS